MAKNWTLSEAVKVIAAGKDKEAIQELNAGQPSYKRIQKVIFRKTEFDKTTTKKIKR